MTPILAALFVGASVATSLFSSKNQARIEEANTKLNVENQRLQTAEAAYERTKSFRKNISSNVALAGMGFGSSSGAKGLTSENISDYFADAAALGRQDLFATTSGSVSSAQTKANRFNRDVNSIFSATSLASDLGLFTPKTPRKVK